MIRKKKAEMGMGTLIIFIAMILVAAVAAGVLISTTGTLQNKALATGKATTYQVGTSIEVIELYGLDASDGDNALEDLYQTIRLSSGSEDIRFEDVLLTLSLSDNSTDYAYTSDAGVSNCTDPVSTSYFAVTYPISASVGHQDGYLVKGDVAKLCFASPRDITVGEEIKTTMIPRVGSPLVVDVDIPNIMVDKRIVVFP
ncbi:hypothetical protein GF327_03530 [Candidatus Woesearchaeota archaeon]|nr:hypothetical protein [Candidatus Woesearchaeota archaeon]